MTLMGMLPRFGALRAASPMSCGKGGFVVSGVESGLINTPGICKPS